jgi:hypothetical protein
MDVSQWTSSNKKPKIFSEVSICKTHVQGLETPSLKFAILNPISSAEKKYSE